MAKHGYKGGFELAASLDYLCLRRLHRVVPDWAYSEVCNNGCNQIPYWSTQATQPLGLAGYGRAILEATVGSGVRPNQLDHYAAGAQQ